MAAGSCGAIQGATSAKITKITTNTTPTAANGLWRAFPATRRRNVMAAVDMSSTVWAILAGAPFLGKDRISGQKSERILHADSGDHLLGIHILRKNPNGSGLCSRGYNQCIPKSYSRLIFDAKCSCNFGGRGFRAPERVAVHHHPRSIFGKRCRDLARNVHIKFLQHLRAKNSSTLAPKFSQNVLRHLVLGFCIYVVGVDQNIGVDEGFIAHATRPCWNGSRRQDETLDRAIRQLAAVRARRLLPLPRESLFVQPAGR